MSVFAILCWSLLLSNPPSFTLYRGASIYSYYGHVLNPHSDTTNEEWLISGGSSGGSAVSVAADMCT